jgi:glucosamine--fructose-6-phosphate aminotransferase (isomerizing)
VALIDEINEQPAVVERLLGTLPDRLRPLVRNVRRSGIEHVLIAARGSSDHTAVYAQYAIGAIGRMPVALATPSLFSRYRQPPRLGRTLVIGISQSGRSPDVVSVLAEGNRQGALTLAVTNDPGSPLAGAAFSVIELGAGPELSVAATKTYTAQLATVATLAAALGELPAAGWRDLRRVPETMASALLSSDAALGMAREASDMTECVVLGRGFNLATALEWALKLMELAAVHAQAYSAADYEHGPMASFAAGDHVLAVMAHGPLEPDIERLVTRLMADRGAPALVVGERAVRGAGWLSFPDRLPEWLSPLVAILPAQLFTAGLAEAKGLDVEHPRGLRKVTLTS